MSRGTGACFGVFGPGSEAFSTGLRTAVETVLAPTREGYGGCAVANDATIAQRISVSRNRTKQPCRSVVGRLLDAFDMGRKRCVRPATLGNERLYIRCNSTTGYGVTGSGCIARSAPSRPCSGPAPAWHVKQTT